VAEQDVAAPQAVAAVLTLVHIHQQVEEVEQIGTAADSLVATAVVDVNQGLVAVMEMTQQ
jgi:hypothetical protein